MLTVTSDLYSKDNDEKITNTTDIKPVIFVMIKGAMLKTLVDSGCEKSVINEDVVKSNCWKYDKVQHPIVLNMANGVVEPVFHHMIKPQISSDDFSGKTESLLMAPIKNYDMVLGRDFLIKYKAKIILEHESSDAQESTSNVEDQEHGMIVPGLDIWCEQKLKRVFIPFGKMMKHIKSSYKDVLMTKNQFDKACDNGGKFYLYKMEPVLEKTTHHTDNNQLDPERERRIKEEFNHIFRDVLPAKLPPDRGIVHHIQLSGTPIIPPRGYRLSLAEKAFVETHLKMLKDLGLIRPSQGPFASPILIVKKPHSTDLRLVIDYRQINSVTVKDVYPQPVTEDIIDSLRGASCYSKLDLLLSFHQTRVNDDDVDKTAFRCHLGTFAWLVTPMGIWRIVVVLFKELLTMF